MRSTRQVRGTRSTFAERQTGREYVDIAPNRDVIARYGLTVRDVQDVVEAAVGGMSVSTAIAGRARFSINIRLGADYRADPQALRALLVPVFVLVFTIMMLFEAHYTLFSRLTFFGAGS